MKSNNIHIIETNKKKFELAMLSDLHWDNPKCQRDVLKRDLDYCLKNEIPVFVNGDFFCLMQGKGDRRGSKSDVLPEHNNSHYFDSVMETACEWFEPYKDILIGVGYGNHETGVIKHKETDVMRNFVTRFNHEYGGKIQLGGYGGWIIVRYIKNTVVVSCRIKYFHGSGGGGIMSKGELDLTRSSIKYEGFDVYSQGHIHENKATDSELESLKQTKRGLEIIRKPIHLMVTGTYKEEYGEGKGGFHVERGAPPKPIGGRILEIEFHRDSKNGEDRYLMHVDSRKFKPF